MELTDSDIIQKNGKKRMHCSRNTFLSHDSECICFWCDYHVKKRKLRFNKISRKKVTFYQSVKICSTQNIIDLHRFIKKIKAVTILKNWLYV